jgi:hypothetical protein
MLKHLRRHLFRPADYFARPPILLDVTDGYCTLGIQQQDRYYFTVTTVTGCGASNAYQWVGQGRPSVFASEPKSSPTTSAGLPGFQPPPLRPHRSDSPVDSCATAVGAAHVCFPTYMNDFLFLANSCEAALLLRARMDTLLLRLCLLRNAKKGILHSTHVGEHLGLTVNLQKGEFRVPPDKVHTLAKQASSLLGRAALNARWLPARRLAAFAGKAQFLYRAVAATRFFLCKLHNVLATRNG